MMNITDKYPDTAAFNFVEKALADKGVSLKDIAYEAQQLQLKYNPELTLEDCLKATTDILHKREILSNTMIALEIDRLATEHKLAEPLQTILEKDLGSFSTDELLAMDCAFLYGGLAISNTGYLDVQKHGLANKLDTVEGGVVNTFVDDIVSALIACTEAKVMHEHE